MKTNGDEIYKHKSEYTNECNLQHINHFLTQRVYTTVVLCSIRYAYVLLIFPPISKSKIKLNHKRWRIEYNHMPAIHNQLFVSCKHLSLAYGALKDCCWLLLLNDILIHDIHITQTTCTFFLIKLFSSETNKFLKKSSKFYNRISEIFPLFCMLILITLLILPEVNT